MSKYEVIFKKIDNLIEQERQDMANLYLAYFDGSSEAQIFSDLKDKTEVLMLEFDGRLVGFTTLQVFEYSWLGKSIRVIYSGDTIVDKAHWGQQALAFAWINRMGELKREYLELPMYWFVIVKGHRTYKYLPTFGKSFYPHWSIDRSDLKPLADALAKEKFGANYNPKTGIVEFPESKGHLKMEIALPTDEEKNKESVQFFLKKNPKYLIGHELVCLCEIEVENMKPLTKRIFSKGIL